MTVDSGGTAVPVRFDFADVARGVHVLTASDLPGYTTPTIPDAIVSGLTTANAGTVEYVALPVELVVPVTSSVGGAALVDAVVTLSPPVGAARPPSSEDPPGTFHFAGVIPDPLPYTLNVSSTLYGSQAVPVPVLPDADGDGILTVPVVLNPTQASISGRAQKQEAAGQAAIDLNNEGTVRLFKLAGPGDTVGVEVTTTTPVAGRYEFLVGETGGYRVQVELAVHATRGAPPVTGVQLGQFRTVEDIVVPRTATAAITVLGDAATAPSLQVVVTQPAGSGLTFSRLLDTFTVAGLDPDVNYRFEVRATGFVTVVVPDTGPLNPEIGGSSTYTVTPAHVMAVVVTTEDASGSETRATVDVRIPSGTVVASLTGTGASNTYLFVGLPAGAGDVVVSAAGYRTRTRGLRQQPRHHQPPGADPPTRHRGRHGTSRRRGPSERHRHGDGRHDHAHRCHRRQRRVQHPRSQHGHLDRERGGGRRGRGLGLAGRHARVDHHPGHRSAVDSPLANLGVHGDVGRNRRVRCQRDPERGPPGADRRVRGGLGERAREQLVGVDGHVRGAHHAVRHRHTHGADGAGGAGAAPAHHRDGHECGRDGLRGGRQRLRVRRRGDAVRCRH